MFTSRSVKIALTAVAFAAALGAVNGNADDGIITKVQEKEGSYCHLRFPAMRSATLASNHPQLKSAQTGDVIDYYGACDHDPLSRGEVITQRREEAQRWANDYES